MNDKKMVKVINKYESTTDNSEIYKDFYNTLKGYADYCVPGQKKKNSSSSVNKDLGGKETQKQEELKEKYKILYSQMMDFIVEKGISYLELFVDAACQLYQDKKNSPKAVWLAVVDAKTLTVFREAHKQIIDLYPILDTLNKTFSVDDYTELTLSPRSYIYGSEINKGQAIATKKLPSSNEEIQGMISLFLQVKDQKRFKEWMKEILLFTPARLDPMFVKEYQPMREVLREWLYDQINGSDLNYKKGAQELLYKDGLLKKIISLASSVSILESEKKDLKTQISELNSKLQEETAEHETRRVKQFEIIQQQTAEISDYKEKLRNFDQCRERLSAVSDKYQAQVSMNERIVNQDDKKIEEITAECNKSKEQLTETLDQLESLKSEHEALQSDYELRMNEIQKLSDSIVERDKVARTDVMKKLITGINEQLYYLTMFYLELKETGKLQTESIELYNDTLTDIDSVLNDLGIQKIGTIDQIVDYDSSIYDAAGGKYSNGDRVIIRGYGWKIGGEVYIKAPVEREN